MKQLLICDKDTFACMNGRIFYHQAFHLPDTALCIDAGQHLYVIEKKDLIAKNLLYILPNQCQFVPFRRLIAGLTHEQANQLAKALQLIRWFQDHHFCSRCGSKTIRHHVEFATICPTCDYHQYPRLQPCVIVAIIKYINHVPHLLLAHHQRAKDSLMYGLIAGFVEIGESLEQCVLREAMEETGLVVENIQYFSSQPWPFPSNLMVGFIADYASGELVIDKQELIHADFFALNDLPKIPPKGTIAHRLIEQVQQKFTAFY